MSILNCQWDRPLAARVRDQHHADSRAAALRNATAAELTELATRLSFAEALHRNGDQYAGHVARQPALKPIHVNGLASIRHQAEDAWSEVQGWWAERCPDPDPEQLAIRSARLADTLLAVPEGLPAAPPCDGLPIPEGYRHLGNTRGRKLPDGSRGTPHALFVRESDQTVWMRCRAPRKAGQLQGYAGPPPAEILGTRGE